MDYGRYGGSVGFVWPRLTPAVKTLMLINVVVFLVNAVLKGKLVLWCGVSWDLMWEGYGLGLARLVTTQFVHSFHDPLHLLLNMLVFYFFGTFVEEAIGTRRLYRLYLLSGAAGGLLHSVLGLLSGSEAPAVGASGAVYGIMVYAACMAPRMRVLFIIFPIELRWLVGVLVFIGVYMTYVQLVGGGSDGVAHGGHLGGALCGFFAYRLPRRRWAWVDRLRGWSDQRRVRASRHRQEVLDRLLDKVHREGLGSLTTAERRFLDRTSQQMRRK
jgi:membrane associated rhomboid family serine protease